MNLILYPTGKNLIFVIGPTGVGKTTLIRLLEAKLTALLLPTAALPQMFTIFPNAHMILMQRFRNGKSSRGLPVDVFSQDRITKSVYELKEEQALGAHLL